MKRQAGFTLVEMAVVVFLIGILATLGITALNTQLANAAISATQSRQYVLRDALMNYLRVNKRLPCPAIDSTGQEKRAGGTPSICTAKFGFIPYAELGLPQTAGLDGWNNFFSYAASPSWTLTYNGTNPTYSTAVFASGFSAGASGTLIVNNRVPATSATPTPNITNSAVAVIVSHGINGSGALTVQGSQNAPPASGTDELQNTPTPTSTPPWQLPTVSFFQRDYTAQVPTGGAGAFDDMVVWLSPNDLLTPLMKDGALPSAQSQWATQITQINNALITYMFTTASQIGSGYCAPPSSQGPTTTPNTFNYILAQNNIPLVDPWGGALTYTPLITRIRVNFVGSLSVTPSGQIYPYTIATVAPNPGAQIPTNATLYAMNQTGTQNYCN